MLAHLVDYARKHNLVAEPGFAPKTIRWGLVLEPRSGSVEVLDLAEEGSTGHTFAKCPELSQPEIKRGGAGCRHFLADSADVVALLSDDPDDPKLRAKHAFFTNLLRQAAGVLPRLADVAAILDDEAALARIQETLRSHKAKPTDKVTFAVLGENPLYPIDSDLWHGWWRTFRRSLGAETSGKPTKRSGESQLVRCLASGELVEPVPTHPKITGLSDVGGLSMGDALASFKQESFCSYGLQQSANAPVSEEMAALYRAALNNLITEHSRRLTKVKVVHWFKDKIPIHDDPMDWLVSGDDTDERAAQRRARELLDAFDTQQRPDLLNNRYYALTLSGAAGRVMVRDWMEGQFPELVAKVDSWFDHLSIIRRDGTALARPPKFLAVLGALARDLKEVPAPWETMMWRVAVRGDRIPGPAHAAALARMKIDILQNESFNHARVGLLKAFHVRQGDNAMQPNLNEEHPSAAYQCGRLMALLAALQYRALGDVGAGVVQRYYAAASSTPALVLGRLTRTAQFHLNKLDSGLARWFETRLAGIWNEIRDRVPRTLTLEEQSLFALGYYQQIAADRQKTQKPDTGATDSATQETAS